MNEEMAEYILEYLLHELDNVDFQLAMAVEESINPTTIMSAYECWLQDLPARRRS